MSKMKEERPHFISFLIVWFSVCYFLPPNSVIVGCVDFVIFLFSISLWNALSPVVEEEL